MLFREAYAIYTRPTQFDKNKYFRDDYTATIIL